MRTRNDLFEEAKSFWPLNLKIKIFRNEENGFMCNPSLVDIYREIESHIAPNEEWKKISTWSFHQALWNLAEISAQAGKDAIYARDVNFYDFNRMMLDNLSGSEWADFNKIYSGWR